MVNYYQPLPLQTMKCIYAVVLSSLILAVVGDRRALVINPNTLPYFSLQSP